MPPIWPRSYHHVGAYLRAHRMNASLTIDDVASLTGMPPSHLRDIECGRSRPERDKWERLVCAIPGVSRQDLLRYHRPWPTLRPPAALWFWWRKSGFPAACQLALFLSGVVCGLAFHEKQPWLHVVYAIAAACLAAGLAYYLLRSE